MLFKVRIVISIHQLCTNICYSMSTELMAEEQYKQRNERERSLPLQPTGIRIAAKIISYIFHPVFVPLMVIWFLAYEHPTMYAGFQPWLKDTAVMGAAFIAFTFFPVITILLLKGLKFIDSIYLRTQKERVIPFLACMIWYFWITYVWFSFGKTRNAVDMPHEAVQFAMATFLSTVIGLMVNIKMKVSLHAISMGIVVTFFTLLAFSQDLNFGIYLTVALFVAGLVCTARFIVSDHTSQEVYGGLAVGVVSMLVGLQMEKWLSS
jgi:hypothetical protein